MNLKISCVLFLCSTVVLPQTYEAYDLSSFFGPDNKWENSQQSILMKLDSLDLVEHPRIISKEDAYNYFVLSRRLRSQVSKLIIYSILRSGANIDDKVANEIYQVGTSLDSRIEAALSRYELSIMSLSEESLKGWFREERFTPYRRRLDRILKAKKYTLGEEANSLLKGIRGLPKSSVDVFWNLHAAIDWPKIGYNGDTLVFNQQNYITLSNLDEKALRDKGMESLFNELKKYEDVFGILYYKRIQGDYVLAKAEGFSSGMEAEWYKRDHIPKGGYMNMLQVFKSNKAVIKEYVKAKSEFLNERMNYSDLFRIINLKNQDYSLENSITLVKAIAKDYDNSFYEKVINCLKQPWSNIAYAETKENTYSIYPPITGNPYFIFNYYPTHKHARALMGAFTLMAIWSDLPEEALPENGDDPAVYANGIIYLGDLMYDEYLAKITKQDKQEKKRALINALDFYWYYAIRWMIFTELDFLVEQKVISGEFVNGSDISKMYLSLLREYFGEEIDIPDHFGMEWMLTHIIFMSYEHQYWPASMAFATHLLGSENKRKEIVSDVFFKAPTILDYDRSYEILKEVGIDMASPEVYESFFERVQKTLKELKSLN